MRVLEAEQPTRARLARAVAAHPALAVCAAVGTVAEGRAALASEVPAVLLTDLHLPDRTGIELIRAARSGGKGTQAMVITVFGDEQHVVAAIEAGALGYLLKDASADSI